MYRGFIKDILKARDITSSYIVEPPRQVVVVYDMLSYHRITTGRDAV